MGAYLEWMQSEASSCRKCSGACLKWRAQISLTTKGAHSSPDDNLDSKGNLSKRRPPTPGQKEVTMDSTVAGTGSLSSHCRGEQGESCAKGTQGQASWVTLKIEKSQPAQVDAVIQETAESKSLNNYQENSTLQVNRRLPLDYSSWISRKFWVQ